MPKDCPIAMDNCPAAHNAAECAVRKVFAILGVDIDVPNEVEAFRENLRFGASMRKAADRGMVTIVTVFVTLVITSITALIWQAITGQRPM